MKPASPYLTVPEAADYLRLTVPAFYTLRARLKADGCPMKDYRLKGLLRFKACDLDALLETVQTKPLRKASGW